MLYTSNWSVQEILLLWCVLVHDMYMHVHVDVPKQVSSQVDHVITVATQGQTTLFKASEVLEQTMDAYRYARSAAQDDFELKRKSGALLNEYDETLKAMIKCRLESQLDEASNKEDHCSRILGEGKGRERERGREGDRQTDRDREKKVEGRGRKIKIVKAIALVKYMTMISLHRICHTNILHIHKTSCSHCLQLFLFLLQFSSSSTSVNAIQEAESDLALQQQRAKREEETMGKEQLLEAHTAVREMIKDENSELEMIKQQCSTDLLTIGEGCACV